MVLRASSAAAVTGAELKDRGVVVEEVDGNYPSKGGKGERAAWFRDSEGNMLRVAQAIS